MKPSLLALSCLPLAASAVKIPVRQAKRDSFGVAQPVSNVANAGAQVLSLTDTKDMIYIANVTIAGQPFPVQLDTGSSDLWISVDKVLGNDSNIALNLTYGIGFAAGSIATAPVTFAGHDIASQAYLAGTHVNNPALSYSSGLLGLGLNSLSSIDSKVKQSGGSQGKTWGQSLLNNVFREDTSTPNFMAFALQRNEDPNKDVRGSFSIGEYEPDYAGVANTAPIPTFPKKDPNRWNVLVDAIIINGQNTSLTSAVPNAPSGKAVGLLDTGTSNVYGPEKIVTAIYSSMSGATFSSSLGKWVVDCDAEVDVSLVIGGRQFDLHPLDMVASTGANSGTCTGSWLPESLTVGKAEYDFLFGDAAMRSIYTVFDFGDFDENNAMGDPYVRLWSLVNGPDASIEFHQVRGGTSKSTFLPNSNVNAASTNANSTPSASTGDSSSGDISDLENKVNKLMKWAPAALGLAGLNVLVLLAVLIFAIFSCVRRRKSGRVPRGDNFGPLPLPGGIAHHYRPVSLQSALVQDGPRPHDAPKFGTEARYSD